MLLDRLREELSKWEQFNESLLQSIPLAIFTTDDQGRIVFVNRNMQEVFGISRQQLVGRSISDFPDPTRFLPLVYEYDKKRMAAALRRLLETGRQQEISVKSYHRSGRIIDLDVRLIQLRNNRDQTTGYAFFGEDVTAKKKLQHLLIQSEKLGGLGQLSASIVHQLKNSQGIINTSLYFLDEVLPSKTAEIEKHFRIIREELERSKRIVDNLLAYSRRTGVEKEEVNLNLLVSSTLSILDKEVTARRVDLKVEYGANIPPMMANFEELKEALLNVIINGIQAMPEGGDLKVTTRWLSGNGKVEIAVEDSGVGISKKDMSQIFYPFFTTKERSDGTGLGLALVRSIIIDGHKGNIRVESEEGIGTVFRIELPLTQEEDGAE